MHVIKYTNLADATLDVTMAERDEEIVRYMVRVIVTLLDIWFEFFFI
jgi:hypothetical protein